MANADTADSEWEYEYDETETETFYVTVDLSSYTNRAKVASSGIKKSSKVAPAASKAARSGNAESNGPAVDPLLGESSTDRRRGVSNGDEEIDEAVDEANDPSATHLATTKTSRAKASLPASAEDTLQILDLHTMNPLIAHKSQLYSCAWSSTVGTDFFFAKPLSSSSSAMDSPDPIGNLDPEEAEAEDADEDEEEDEEQGNSNHGGTEKQPLRSLPGVDLLATSRIRLTARPVNTMPAKPRPTVTAFRPAAPAASTSMNTPAVQPDTVGTSSSDNANPQRPLSPIQIPLEPSASVPRQNQAAFLGRLMDIKRAKGETDEVTVTFGITADGANQRKGLAEVARTRGTSGRGRGRGAGRPRALSRSGGRGRGRGRGEEIHGNEDAGIAHSEGVGSYSGWRALQDGTGQGTPIADGRGISGPQGGFSVLPQSQLMNRQEMAGPQSALQSTAQDMLPPKSGDVSAAADVEMEDR